MFTNETETIKHSIVFVGSICASCVTVMGAFVRIIIWLVEMKSDIRSLKDVAKILDTDGENTKAMVYELHDKSEKAIEKMQDICRKRHEK